MADISKITIGSTTYNIKAVYAIRDKNGVCLSRPSASTTSSSISGWFKIYINSETSWMTRFSVRVYEAYKGYDIAFQGYNYGSSHWYSPKAQLISSSENSIEVKFGYDGNYKLWVAVPAHEYYGIMIHDVVNGYTQVEDFSDKFTITYMASLTGTVQETQTLYRPWLRNEIVSNASYASSAGSVAWGNVTGKPTFATVATSGSYNDLSNKPTIPAAQVQTDWNATSGMGVLLNKPSSLPASDVYAWAKAATKPTYTASEVGALAVNGKAVSAEYADVAGYTDFASNASNATTASKLSVNAGGTTTPVYFSGGVPVALSYTIAKSVPSDAKFTDTTYESKAAASGGTAVSLCTTGEKYTWNNKANAFSVTDGDPTLAWSTRSKVATIAGVDVHVTMPANPGGGSGIVKYQSSSSTSITVNSMSAGEMTYVFMSSTSSKRLRMPSGGSYIVIDMTGISVYNEYGSELASRMLQSMDRMSGNSYTSYRYWSLALVVRVG